MITQNGLMGLGIIEPLPQNVLDYKVPIPATDTGGNWLDKLLNTVNKVAPTVKTGISVYDQIKNTSSKPTANPNPYTGSNTNVMPQPTQGGMSTGAKVAIGVASAGVLTALVMAATGKKKKKK